MEITETKTKFCKHCGEKIPEDAVICTKCGRQVEQISSSNPNIVINNTNTNTNSNINHCATGKPKNKWISLALCIFTVCGHKFYEGKIGMGIIYLFTVGLFGIGWFIDIISLLFKPNPYFFWNIISIQH